jgi:hypothetical protein
MRTPSILSLLGVVACHGPAPPPQPAAPEPESVAEPMAVDEVLEPLAWRHEFVQELDAGSFAVVDRGTAMYTQPRVDAASCVYGQELHPGAVRVLGRGDGFVEVELDWPSDPRVHHCVLAPLETIGLRMFVREDELAQVTTTSLALETGDQTGIVIAPGVLVREPEVGEQQLYSRQGEQSRRGWWTTDNFTISSALELPDLGKFYTPVLSSSLREVLATPAEFTVTGKEASSVPLIHYGGGEVVALGQIYAQSPHDPDHVVVGSPCLQVAGHLRGTRLGGTGGAAGGTGGPREVWTVPRDAVLTWRSGGVAGRLHSDLELGAAPKRRGDRRCFYPPLQCADGYEGLEVCVPSSTPIEHASLPGLVWP